MSKNHNDQNEKKKAQTTIDNNHLDVTKNDSNTNKAKQNNK